ncbi:hypothetical protein ACRARG_19985 [Pseudooceanicola sp. C21-150M6]|uniref:hypothetical protein n=1 Tax=Pseudooceanicola sp. C21-150M6 TaxID=3434355 RepID=UPI003D7FB681
MAQNDAYGASPYGRNYISYHEEPYQRRRVTLQIPSVRSLIVLALLGLCLAAVLAGPVAVKVAAGCVGLVILIGVMRSLKPRAHSSEQQPIRGLRA